MTFEDGKFDTTAQDLVPFDGAEETPRRFTASHAHVEHLLYDDDDHDENHDTHGHYSNRPIDKASVKDAIDQLPAPYNEMSADDLTRRLADSIDRQARREDPPTEGITELVLDEGGQWRLTVQDNLEAGNA